MQWLAQMAAMCNCLVCRCNSTRDCISVSATAAAICTCEQPLQLAAVGCGPGGYARTQLNPGQPAAMLWDWCASTKKPAGGSGSGARLSKPKGCQHTVQDCDGRTPVQFQANAAARGHQILSPDVHGLCNILKLFNTVYTHSCR